MTRESSAPAWSIPTIDPRVLDVVDRMRAVSQLSPLELRRRAKTIPLGELPMSTQVPTETRKSNLVLIGDQNAARVAPIQRCAPVPELSPDEQEFMDVFDSLGPVVSAQRLADELDCSVQSLRGRELHNLQVKGVLVSVQGRRGGYRRAR